MLKARFERSVAVSLALVGLSAGMSASKLSAAPATFVSDSDVGTTPGHFRYFGRWEHVRNVRDGRFLGSSSRTFTVGAVLTFTFVGSAVRVFGVRGPGGGHAVVTLDRVRQQDVDFYAIHKQVRAIVFESPLLHRHLHTLAIAAVADSRGGGRQHSFINVSGAAYQ